MKREFKKGDRVLGRENDLREWEEYTFVQYTFVRLNEPEDYPFQVIDENGVTWDVSQCRHIEDFRTGDKVQVSNGGKNWEDAVYACYVPRDSFKHWVYTQDMDDIKGHKLCRWHPSMTWANKEEQLTLEEKVDKMWAQFKTNEQ